MWRLRRREGSGRKEMINMLIRWRLRRKGNSPHKRKRMSQKRILNKYLGQRNQ